MSIKNPLGSDVTIKASCVNKQVLLAPTTLLPANSVTAIDVGYRPLLVGDAFEVPLLLECPELGLFQWGLKLVGVATNPERSMAFNVPLGSRETQVGGRGSGGEGRGWHGELVLS